MTTGVQLIAIERDRQMVVEGHGPIHDDTHMADELAVAAAAYATPENRRGYAHHYKYDRPMVRLPVGWPWEPEAWKPGDPANRQDRIRELVRAGALLAAEIDRLQRLDLAMTIGETG